jgi:phospholipase/carboxylesterase
MNRISTWPIAKPTQQAFQATLKSDIAAAKANSSTAYSAWVPLHYEENYAYPLLVWLHGAEDDEQQLTKVMPLVSLRNCVAVAPRASTSEEICGEVAHSWSQSLEGIAGAEQRVAYFIDLMMARYNISRERVFVAGYAEGGTMALRLAMLQPDRFAGAASFGGAFPATEVPLRNLKQARGVSVLMAQGRDSVLYNEAEFCHDMRLLHCAGMSTTFRQYPGEDELSSAMLSDLNAWMMNEITGGQACTDSQSTQWLDDQTGS